VGRVALDNLFEQDVVMALFNSSDRGSLRLDLLEDCEGKEEVVL